MSRKKPPLSFDWDAWPPEPPPYDPKNDFLYSQEHINAGARRIAAFFSELADYLGGFPLARVKAVDLLEEFIKYIRPIVESELKKSHGPTPRQKRTEERNARWAAEYKARRKKGEKKIVILTEIARRDMGSADKWETVKKAITRDRGAKFTQQSWDEIMRRVFDSASTSPQVPHGSFRDSLPWKGDN